MRITIFIVFHFPMIPNATLLLLAHPYTPPKLLSAFSIQNVVS
jgi:hypothetical protein